MHLFQFTIKLVEFRSPRSKFNELISESKSSFVTETVAQKTSMTRQSRQSEGNSIREQVSPA